MASSGFSFRKFLPEEEEWQLFREQLEEFFKSSKVPAESKVPVLVNCLEARTYKLLRDLSTPDLPSSKSYDDLCKLLSTHFTPTTVIHKERRQFFNAARGENGPESVKMWMARIKRLSANCVFGTTLEHNLTNKFICGLSGRAFDRVCEEDEKITLEKAMTLALKYDEEETQATTQAVHLVRNRQQSGRSTEASVKKEVECYTCGKKGHIKPECRFRDAVCRKCRKKGHLEAVCRAKAKHYLEEETPSSQREDGAGEAEDVELEQNFLSENEPFSIFNIIWPKTDSAPIKALVRVGNETIPMEIDSGAAISAISDKFRRDKMGKFRVSDSSLKLVGYSGEQLKVLGSIEPEVKFNGEVRRIKFAVVEKGGPPLLGRNFIREFNLHIAPMNYVTNESSHERLEKLVKQYDCLFSDGLGKYTGLEVDVALEEGAKPIFCKPRPVPLCFEKAVEKELNEAEAKGIITKCDSSEWGTPVVPVLKSDGESIRLCGDYKVTVNKFVKDVRHPLPRIEEVMGKLNGGKLFSKLDLSRAYNQFELSEESKKVCALSTHKGVYLMNRLPFGIKPASGIVQRELEKLFANEPFVINFMDDVLISGRNDEEHLATLARVFEILKKAGLTLSKEKCTFFRKKVNYLGYEISEQGVTKTKERLKAISEAKAPENVSEVRAFSGMVNYYARFVEGLATIMSPLYDLLKKGSAFNWSEECQNAFDTARREICKDVTLMHFDPLKEIVLICDASKVGVSAVLAHRINNEDRPIAFASRVLSPTERDYSVLHKEGLAIVYGLNKFYMYLAGNKFVIKTDHNPLVSIFGPKKGIPVMAAGRIQRWANFISGFNYRMEHVSSNQNVADYASRCPVESWEMWKEDSHYLHFITSEASHILDSEMIKIATQEDQVLKVVSQYVLEGREDLVVGVDLAEYQKVFSELTVEEGVLMRGYRVVIPTSLRVRVLEELHASHLGMVKMKSLARGYVWWPGLDKDIENQARECQYCLNERPSPELAKLITWSVPERPWSRIHMDYAGPVNGIWYLIIVDALTKWTEVFPTTTITAAFTIERLMECLARFGLVDSIVTDNGTQFTAEKYESFLKANGIKHILTAPGHPATNGAAENFVKTFKAALKKALAEKRGRNHHEILSNFLMAYRSSEHCSSKVSPAVAMLGRPMVTKFDKLVPRKTTNSTVEQIKDNLHKAQHKQREYHRGRRVQKFDSGDRVLVRDYTDPNQAKWMRGAVDKALGERNYRVCLDKNQRTIKRHIDQMLPDTSLAVDKTQAGKEIERKIEGCCVSSGVVSNHSAKIVLRREEESSQQFPVANNVHPIASSSRSNNSSTASRRVEQVVPPHSDGEEEEVLGFNSGWSVVGKKRKCKEKFPDLSARRTSKRLELKRKETGAL